MTQFSTSPNPIHTSSDGQRNPPNAMHKNPLIFRRSNARIFGGERRKCWPWFRWQTWLKSATIQWLQVAWKRWKIFWNHCSRSSVKPLKFLSHRDELIKDSGQLGVNRAVLINLEHVLPLSQVNSEHIISFRLLANQTEWSPLLASKRSLGWRLYDGCSMERFGRILGGAKSLLARQAVGSNWFPCTAWLENNEAFFR